MGVYLTIFLYSLVSSLFFPIFQSLVFLKACLTVSPNSTDIDHCYSKEAAAKDENVHSLANIILMSSSTGLCVTAFFTSRWIGKLSDSKSRKLAFLIPFTGLFISDLTILFQVIYPHLSPYYFIVSEVIYGVFGGYMSITSGAFAIISSIHKDSKERAKAIARLEGTIALGSTVGFLLSSQLKHIEYLGMAIFFLVAHAIAFLSALLIKDIKNQERPLEHLEAEKKESLIFTGFRIYQNKTPSIKKNLKVLYFSFAVSYFTFIGSTRILYFYLKHKFFWSNEPFGYLKAINQGATTVFAMFVYPFLKNQGVHDVHLALFGLITRSFGRAWYALAWSDVAVFQVVWFEMWSKFPATALRSLISSNVAEYERGTAFSIVAVLEAFCNLTSSWVFHTLWPLSLSFCPEFSFAIMPLCISPAFIWMFFNRQALKNSETPALAPEVPVIQEEEKSLRHIPTETDSLTGSSDSNQ